ncbi:hypothetical protein [Pseudanabaena sp. UWO310]|uniref:hypothetical protein n=1 Tax=Pseudanabaena sp. UWO310 TaxID=2480795 RepID=UPI0016809923|nr:hypothetical protein [Pseudanabaena sp. UWO310]
MSINFSYSLGDAIDWKHLALYDVCDYWVINPLLARGRDRLETLYLRIIILST